MKLSHVLPNSADLAEVRRTVMQSGVRNLYSSMSTPVAYQVTEEIAQKPKRQRASAIWTMFGSWMLLLVFALCTNGFVDLWQVLGELLTGKASIAQLHTGSMMRMAPTIAAMVAINLVLVIPIGMLVQKIVPLNNADHGAATMFDTRNRRKHLYLVILITAIYLPYGLLGAFIAHVVYDIVLFASSRVDVFDLGEKLLIAYNATVGGIAAYFFNQGDKSVFDMKHWFDEGLKLESMPLPGWQFSDYVFAVVMLYCFSRVIMEALLLDHDGGSTIRELFRSWWREYGAFMLAAWVLAQVLFGVTYLPLVGVVITLMLFAPLYVRSASGSGVARTFWEALLLKSLVLCAMLSLDIVHAAYLLGIILLIELPDAFIRHFDKDVLPGQLAQEVCSCDCVCSVCNPKPKTQHDTTSSTSPPAASAVTTHTGGKSLTA